MQQCHLSSTCWGPGTPQPAPGGYFGCTAHSVLAALCCASSSTCNRAHAFSRNLYRQLPRQADANMGLGNSPVTPLKRARVSGVVKYFGQQVFELSPCLALLQHLSSQLVLGVHNCRQPGSTESLLVLVRFAYVVEQVSSKGAVRSRCETF